MKSHCFKGSACSEFFSKEDKPLNMVEDCILFLWPVLKQNSIKKDMNMYSALYLKCLMERGIVMTLKGFCEIVYVRRYWVPFLLRYSGKD